MAITNAQLKTPGVYIDETSLLPPSIVQVSTAIPVFIGYTNDGPVEEPKRIVSIKEYEDIFGKGYKYRYNVDSSGNTVTVGNDGGTPAKDFPAFGTYFFYEAIRMYFLNGGGPCYIISVGNHPTAASSDYIDQQHFIKGLNLIDKMDEPTLVSVPEAVNLSSSSYGEVMEYALNLAYTLQDKFVLIDSAKGQDLRKAAVQTIYRGDISVDANALAYGASYFPHMETSMSFTIDEENSKYDGTDIDQLAGSGNYGLALGAIKPMTSIKLPPSSIMAGIYAKSDREFGVWKAPANVPVQGVTKPEFAISDSIQEGLNVDATTGKSINAIRSFAGRGTLVWGARTLAGNDNEWRYIQVRRLFMTVEESIKKAIQPFVFENNDAKTWVKVNSMIRSYLNELWQDGALMGTTQDEAFFVQVGLGTTMTQEDILKGRMNVKVGLAAVRPAEFIVLEFSHHLNQ